MPEINIPPGVVKTLSGPTAIGRFIDSNNVRFFNGKPEKIGGNIKLTATAMLGIPRGLHAYIAPSQLEVIVAGTERRLYAINYAYTVSSITPLRGTTVITNPFTTISGSAVVNVTDVAHGARQNDIVNFSGASAVGGITLAGDYTIATIIDADNYTVVHSSTASSSAGPGGGTVTAKYELNSGTTDAAESTGYGMGAYGMESYGTPRTVASLLVDPRTWSITNYGNDALATYQGGKIYLWNQDSDTRAVALGGTPTDCLFVFVTPERFIVALRASMEVSWPDRDDPTDWTPTDLNTANTRTLGTGSKLIAGCALAGVSLIWSNTGAYAMQYIGGNSIYSTDLLGDNCGIIGPNAFCTVSGQAFWLGMSSFMMYAGQIAPIPRQDEILEWVITNLDTTKRFKTTCWFNPIFLEVWWSFVGPDSTDGEPDLTVAVCIKDWSWFPGTARRVGRTLRVSKSRNPLLTSPTGYLYEHEIANDKNDNGAALDWFIETGDWRIPEAKQSVDIFGFAPDFERIVGDIDLEVTGKDRPQSSDSDSETATLADDTEIADLHVAGRYFRYRMSQTGVVDGDFRDGSHILEAKGAGMRR